MLNIYTNLLVQSKKFFHGYNLVPRYPMGPVHAAKCPTTTSLQKRQLINVNFKQTTKMIAFHHPSQQLQKQERCSGY